MALAVILAAVLTFLGTKMSMNIEAKEILHKERRNQEIMNYFNDICIGAEHGWAPPVTHKFRENAKIYVVEAAQYGRQMKFIDSVIFAFNELPTDGFKMELTDDLASANVQVYIVTLENARRVKGFENLSSDHLGCFVPKTEGHSILSSTIYVNADISILQQKAVLLEELVQAMGFWQDSPLYTNSVFYAYKGAEKIHTLKLSELDKQVIRLLYHPKMKVGLHKPRTVEVMREILEEGI